MTDACLGTSITAVVVVIDIPRAGKGPEIPAAKESHAHHLAQSAAISKRCKYIQEGEKENQVVERTQGGNYSLPQPIAYIGDAHFQMWPWLSFEIYTFSLHRQTYALSGVKMMSRRDTPRQMYINFVEEADFCSSSSTKVGSWGQGDNKLFLPEHPPFLYYAPNMGRNPLEIHGITLPKL